MPHRFPQAPRSCDLLDLFSDSTIDRAGGSHAVVDESGGPGAAGFLVWLVDDSDTVVVRSAASLSAATEAARAYRAAWGGHVQLIEGPDGAPVPRTEWEHLVESTAPLSYVYTVELRSPHSTRGPELVSALWTSTDLTEALKWRNALPERLRRRALVVSNAPDGHYPYPETRASSHVSASGSGSGSETSSNVRTVVRFCSPV